MTERKTVKINRDNYNKLMDLKELNGYKFEMYFGSNYLKYYIFLTDFKKYVKVFALEYFKNLIRFDEKHHNF